MSAEGNALKVKKVWNVPRKGTGRKLNIACRLNGWEEKGGKR